MAEADETLGGGAARSSFSCAVYSRAVRTILINSSCSAFHLGLSRGPIDAESAGLCCVDGCGASAR